MTTIFERCVSWVLEWETGKLTNHSWDQGGPTRWGISQVANPDVDVVNLTRQRAAEIYSERYWLPLRCQRMPAPVAMIVFDHSVHVSQGASAKNLQKLLRVSADGVVGDRTMNALGLTLREKSSYALANELLDRRADLQIDAFRRRAEKAPTVAKSAEQWITVKGFVSRWVAVCAFAQRL